MLKRTTGRLLLTLLVITGLAGTVNDSSLSQRERKQAINLMKSSRAEVLASMNGLSTRQIHFRPAPGEPTIGELLTNMVGLEKKGTDEIKANLENPSNPEKRLKIALTDDQLLAEKKYSVCRKNLSAAAGDTPKDPSEAIRKFILLRNQQIKYIRTSTEDLRNHVISTPAGWIDCYQYYLLIADRSSYTAQKIRKIRSMSSFPKK